MPSWRQALALIPALVAAGCSVPTPPSSQVQATAPAGAWRVARGEGWAVRVPTSARVEATGSELRVDAQDGRWWFDVRWTEAPEGVLPVRTATQWAEEGCRPIRWDVPAVPRPGVWTAGGFCTIGERDHWVLAVVEDHADGRRLLTGLIADKGRVPYEDLWVTFVGTALTLTAADEPRPLVKEDLVRARLREAQQQRQDDIAAAQLPRPGGGLLSKVVSEALIGDLWRPRQHQPLPTALAPRPVE